MESNNGTINMQNSTQASEDMSDFEASVDLTLVMLWGLCMVVFLCFPVCSSQHRRQLCLRRIRERRWIADDAEQDDWFREAMRRRQARRHQLDDEQHHFQTSRTQEDEIREQFLKLSLEKFTTTLSQSDIHKADRRLVRSLSQGSLDQISCSSQKSMKQEISHSRTEDTMDNCSVDIEAPPTKPSSSNSLPNEDSDDMAVLDFQETNEIVSVPLPGQENNLEASSTRRSVPSGCAICLSTFAPEEKITWSSNPECAHIFHYDCVLHWFLTVGRKVQRKRMRQRPQMNESEALDLICKFPILCPCCRQSFSIKRKKEDPSKAEDQETQNDPRDENEVNSTESAASSDGLDQAVTPGDSN